MNSHFQTRRQRIMDHVLNFIKSRRSTRKFTDVPVPEESLRKVLEAGRYAPSGRNVQQTHFIVVKNKAVLDRLAELVRDAFARTSEPRGNGYVFHYNPNILIITANTLDNPNNLADCACALENMMLMANALDLGSCWINQLKQLPEDPALVSYLKELGMADNERVFGALALGYADTEDGKPERTPKERKGNPVTIVE